MNEKNRSLYVTPLIVVTDHTDASVKLGISASGTWTNYWECFFPVTHAVSYFWFFRGYCVLLWAVVPEIKRMMMMVMTMTAGMSAVMDTLKLSTALYVLFKSITD
jgi:hypothetical protein